MKLRWIAAPLLAVALTAAAGASFARCSLGKIAELPVTMSGAMPMVSAKVNGTDVRFVADSGSFYSLIWPNEASELHLRVDKLPFQLLVWGVGGATQASYTTVRLFTLANIPLHNVEFIVAGNDLENSAAGLLGQNILRVADTEYDLANGVIRLMQPRDCNKDVLAYWATDKPYSVIPIEFATKESPFTIGVAYLNGTKLRVMFDTGSARSGLSVRAAQRAGVKVTDSDVRPAGEVYGMGRRRRQSWIAPFASFKIGDEEVHNTRLRITDMEGDADMLIGADFFLSNRIYIATGQRKLYFTYNGGPVFNLEGVPLSPVHASEPAGAPTGAASTAAAPTGAGPTAAASNAAAAAASTTAQPFTAGTSAPATAGAATDTAANTSDPTGAAGLGGTAALNPATPAPAAVPPEPLEQPTDAAGFARRGEAFFARHEFDRAVADLNRACELAPNEPEYFYQRGIAHEGNRQPFQAMQDFDAAVKLKPDHVPALVARAALRLGARDPSAAAADLDVVDHAVPKDSDVRLALGNLYGRAGRLESAIAQFNLWLVDRGDNPHRGDAYFGRCRARALLGRDLSKALSDCNDAVRLSPKAARGLDTRALVRLRMGEFDKSIADYDAALSLAPKLAWSLYGRGLDELHKGMTAAGQADIAAATALQPQLPQEAQRYGLVPP